MAKTLPSELAQWMKTGHVSGDMLVGLEAGPGGWVAYTVPDGGQWPYRGIEDTYPGTRVTEVFATPERAFAALTAGQTARDGDRDQLDAWRRRALAAENQLRRRSLAEERRERAEKKEESNHGN